MNEPNGSRTMLFHTEDFLFTESYDLYEFGDSSDDVLTLDVPFAPTEERIVREMLELSEVGKNDRLYDLGCGDGRIIVTAARDYGARGVGIELDGLRLEQARQNAKWNGVRHMLTLIEDDLLAADISEATVVALYLLPAFNLELRPRLLNELQPGTRIVSHAFDMGDWQPDEVVACHGTQLFLWIVPAAIAGTWQWHSQDGRSYRTELEQTFQEIRGRAWIDDKPAQLQSARLTGARLELAIRAEDADAPEIFVSHYRDGQLLPEPGSPQVAAGTRP